MAIARDQSKTGSAAASATLAIQLDDVLSTDDTVIVTIAWRGTEGAGLLSVVSDNNVGALARLPGYPVENAGFEGGGIWLEKWAIGRCPATPAFPTITITHDQAVDIGATIEVFTDVRRFAARDRHADATEDDSTISTGTTPATQEADELLHAGWAWYTDAALSGSPTNSFGSVVQVSVASSLRVVAAHRVVSATGTYESTATIASGTPDAAGGIDTFFEENPGSLPSGTSNIIPIIMALEHANATHRG